VRSSAFNSEQTQIKRNGAAEEGMVRDERATSFRASGNRNNQGAENVHFFSHFALANTGQTNQRRIAYQSTTK